MDLILCVIHLHLKVTKIFTTRCIFFCTPIKKNNFRSSECGQKFKLKELVALDGENGFKKVRVSVPFGCQFPSQKDKVGQKSNNV